MTTTDRLQGLRTGLGLKAPCVVASTANLVLSSTQLVDGIAVGSNQRVLVKDQTDLKENGIYTAGPLAWARTKDFDGAGDAIPGTAVYVDRGPSGGGKFYAINSSSTSTEVVITSFVSSDADDKVWSLLSVALAGVSSFSQDTLFPLGTAAAWRSTDGLDVRDASVAIASTDIASSAIVAAKIADDAVITAKITDNAVTLAKLATGTPGNLITYSSTGDAAAVATGSTGQVLTSNGANTAPTMQAIPDTVSVGTEQATTSGTEFDYTGISSTARRITVIFNGVSLTGSENFLVQIGDSGGLETTGYVSTSQPANASAINSTAGFIMFNGVGASAASGHMVLIDISSTGDGLTWTASHSARTGTGTGIVGGGTKTLSARLDRLTLLITGANTFDAGSVNILVE